MTILFADEKLYIFLGHPVKEAEHLISSVVQIVSFLRIKSLFKPTTPAVDHSNK